MVCKVIFMSNPTKVMLGSVELWLSWGFDNFDVLISDLLPYHDFGRVLESSGQTLDILHTVHCTV